MGGQKMETSMVRRLDNALTPPNNVAALLDAAFRIGTSLIFIIGGAGISASTRRCSRESTNRHGAMQW
jgi:hypothetical protein